MKPIIVALLTLIYASLPSSTNAQTISPSTQVGKQVFVRLISGYRGYEAEFDTDGQNIGGLNEENLKNKLTKIKSAASVLNFMAQNGYRVSGFSSTQAGTGRGNGGEFNGYALLFEQIR